MVANKLSKQDVLDKAKTLDFPGGVAVLHRPMTMLIMIPFRRLIESVIDYFCGSLGIPYGGFPEPLRSEIIRDRRRIDTRPGLSLKPYDFKKTKSTLREKYGKGITDCDVMSYCMYPAVFEAYMVRGFIDIFC